MPAEPGTPYVMQGIELASSLVAGADRTRAPLRRTGVVTSDLPGVLENVLLRSLQRPPCVVAFSGGRDSAGLLAAAARAARRHGLPLPIPATNRFPGARDADENQWQDMVVRHLGLEDWVRADITDELDLIGPVAAPLLRRHGPLWPPNSHFGVLLARHARGGTFVTGVGGDEVLAPSAYQAARAPVRRASAAAGGRAWRRRRPRALGAARLARPSPAGAAALAHTGRSGGVCASPRSGIAPATVVGKERDPHVVAFARAPGPRRVDLGGVWG